MDNELPGMPDQTKRGRPKSAKTLSMAAKAKTQSVADIQEIFDYWQTVLRAGSPIRAKLDHDRTIRIGAAIHDYGKETCMKVIDGAANSPWHRGQNPQNKRYDDISIIFNTADRIERFIELATKRSAEQEFLNE